MKFWRSFSKKAVLRQLLFVLFIFALLIPVALWDSNTQVKVTFEADTVYIKSDPYKMTVAYDLIESVELVELEKAGEKVTDSTDNDIIRTGTWRNDTWGEYSICADLDASNCIVIHLKDGRTFVFSRKDNQATAEDFAVFQTYLNP